MPRLLLPVLGVLLLGLLLAVQADAATVTVPCDTTDGWVALDAAGVVSDPSPLSVDGSVLHQQIAGPDRQLLVQHTVRPDGLLSLNLQVQATLDTILVVVLSDVDGARFVAARPLAAGVWTDLVLAPADFAPDPEAPTVKRKLDPLRLVPGIILVDAASGGGRINELQLAAMTIEHQAVTVHTGDLTVTDRMTLSTPLLVTGNVLVLPGGRLTVRNTRLTVQGSIAIDGGTLLVSKGVLEMVLAFAHQQTIDLTGSASWRMSGAVLQTGGPPVQVYFGGQASINLTDTRVYGWMTASSNGGRATITRLTPGCEWVLDPSCRFRATACENLLTWMMLAGVVADPLHLPATVPSSWRSTTHDIQLRRCPAPMWGLITLGGTQVTVVDSDLLAVGMYFQGNSTAILTDLQTGQLPYGGLIDTGERRLEFLNSSVGTWNVYAADQSTLTITDCLLGEVWGISGTATIAMTGGGCDGTGGYIRVQGDTQVALTNTTITCEVNALEQGHLTLTDSTVTGQLTAAGAAVVDLVRTPMDRPAIIQDTAQVNITP